MGFTTPACASLLSASLLLTGCSAPSAEHGIELSRVDIRTGPRRVEATFFQNLKLSAEAQQALEHGVPLVVEVRMELRDALTLTLLHDEARQFEIRYLPMLEDYQLRSLAGGEPRAFPRLRHALAELGQLELEFDTGPLAPGQYELRARTQLSLTHLPAPMTLPARFSTDWRHDSRWTTWPFEINV
ncbi:MAG: DUF4390 domain-containing protein [Xanthomonadales bacterium]|nr:DUF4390 domain-containing protein [Xanthomonadales bacterium]